MEIFDCEYTDVINFKNKSFYFMDSGYITFSCLLRNMNLSFNVLGSYPQSGKLINVRFYAL